MILKPDPGNAQELYLGSLQALGISTRDQDVRFVEDDWKSPALGANGLGWEVWLNGQVRNYSSGAARVMLCGRWAGLTVKVKKQSRWA